MRSQFSQQTKTVAVARTKRQRESTKNVGAQQKTLRPLSSEIRLSGAVQGHFGTRVQVLFAVAEFHKRPKGAVFSTCCSSRLRIPRSGGGGSRAGFINV